MQDNAQNSDDLGAILDTRILELTMTDVSLTPAAKIALEGAFGVSDMDKMHERILGIEITAPHRVSPVEMMRAKGMPEWEYLAAMRFRADFDIVFGGSTGVLNYERLGIYDTEMTRLHRKQGGAGKAGARPQSAYAVADAKISAMQRRGTLLRSVGNTSFFLAEAIVGFEYSATHVAKHMGETQQYIARRFREALHDLGGFYRLHARGPRSGVMRSWQSTNDEAA